MSIINDIFRTYAPQYLDRFGADIPAQHRKVIADICACRTEANGTLIFAVRTAAIATFSTAAAAIATAPAASSTRGNSGWPDNSSSNCRATISW